MNPPQTKRWRILRRCLVGLAVFITLIGLFYTEEDWRGQRAWASCKRALEAQGVKMDWASYIPAPVPADQNVFGVPEMQKWFVGRGSTELSKKLAYPGYPAGRVPSDTEYPNSSRIGRLVVAELTISLPDASTPSTSGATVLHWGDAQAQAQTGRLIKDALGPVIMAPGGFNFILRSPEEIRRAQIFLQCQTAPTAKELLEFLPKPIANTDFPDSEKIQVEPLDNGSYKVTMLAPDTVAEFLKWSEQLQPEFALIHKALQGPYIRMGGNYSDPLEIPIPNFVCVRIIAQTLATMAQCHLLQGKPEEALRHLTFMHDLCRILEGSRPMTLVSAMINVAVRGLYVETLADGLRWHAWREPQLAVLEEQLQQINLLPPVKQALEMGRVFECRILETSTPNRLGNFFNIAHGNANSWKDREDLVLLRLMPHGWIYQNIVTIANLYPNVIASLDPAGQIVFPDKLHPVSFHPSPYACLAIMALPNFSKAVQTTAKNQTMLNQALIACALERYHLAHGEYPDTLGALAPQFIAAIPHDVIGGQPPHYRRATEGTFILYSIGWNGRDHGGVRGKTDADGDWVWGDFPL